MLQPLSRALRTEVCAQILERLRCALGDVKAKSQTDLDCEHVSAYQQGNQREKGANAWPSFGEGVPIVRGVLQ